MAERIPIPSISKFLDHPGEPVASIGDWMFLFDRYIMVCDSGRTTALTSAEKNSLLFMYLGTEGSRIMKSNPVLTEIDTGTYGNFKDAVIRQFSRDKSVVRAQFEFQNRNQEQSEPITKYITALRSLAADCSFGDKHDEGIALQLVVGSRSHIGRTNCLRMRTLDLDEIINTLRTEEVTQSTAELLEGKKTGSIQKLQRQKPRQPEREDRKESKACLGCGSPNHRHGSQECPAKGKRCTACNKLNHFERACLAKNRNNTGRNKWKRVSLATEDDAQILKAYTGRNPKIFTEVDISDGSRFHKTRIEADSGADITTMTESLYKDKFGHLPLMASTANVQNFDNSILQIRGVFKSKIRMFGRSHQDVIHVVPDGHSCVIGMNFLTPLEVMLDCVELCAVDREEALRKRPDGQIQAARTVFADWTKVGIQKEYPNLMQDSLGTFPDYKHEITLKEGAKPTVC
ncbi:MAG: hypothetical protein GY696_34080 [Gammaproteobacteria bacterium]|nr:hypothetical protein [Gammaproteobacteria bacterium]